MSTATRKFFEVSTYVKDEIDAVKEFFEQNESLLHLNIYQSKDKSFILIAEFETPIKVTLTEDPFKDVIVDKFMKYEKRQKECEEEHKQIYEWKAKGKAKPKAVKAAPKEESTSIEGKLDRIIELLEELLKKK